MTAAQSPPAGLARRDILPTGLTVFLAAVYAPFVVAALLAAGSPGTSLTALTAVIFLVFAVGTAVSAVWNRLPLVLAPGVGLAALFSQTTSPPAGGGPGTPAAILFIAFTVAALLVFVLSVVRLESGRTLRTALIVAIPKPLADGIVSGIGALLLATSVKLLEVTTLVRSDAGCVPLTAVQPMIVLIAGIVAFLLFWAMFSTAAAQRQTGRIDSYALRVSVALFIVLVLYYFGFQPPASDCPVLPTTGFSLLAAFDAMAVLMSGGIDQPTLFQIVALALTAAFVMTFDIPGSPYHFATQRLPPGAGDPPERAAEFNRGFGPDALVSLGAAAIGISPTIYYAENTVIEHGDGDGTRVVAPSREYMAAGLFAAALFAGMWVLLAIPEIDPVRLRYAVNFTVAGLLAATGLRLVAVTIAPQLEAGGAPQSRVEMVKRNLPTAILLTLIPLQGVGFEFAFPLSLLAFLATRPWNEASGDRAGLVLLSTWAGLTVLFWAITWIVPARQPATVDQPAAAAANTGNPAAASAVRSSSAPVK